MNAENLNTISHYWQALCDLTEENRKWGSNKERFRHWDDQKRIVWIDHIEDQAVKGLPMAQEIVTKVITLRMLG